MSYWSVIVNIFTDLVNILDNAQLGSHSLLAWFVLVLGLQIDIAVVIGLFKRRK